MKSLWSQGPCLPLMEPCCTACARVLKGDFLWPCNIWNQYRAHRCARQGGYRWWNCWGSVLEQTGLDLRLVIDCLADHFSNHLFTNTMTAKSFAWSLKDTMPNRLWNQTYEPEDKDPKILFIILLPLLLILILAKYPVLAYEDHVGGLSASLAMKVNEHGRAAGKEVVVAWGRQYQAIHKATGHLQSEDREADTKIVLHALDATADGATNISHSFTRYRCSCASNQAVCREVNKNLICYWKGRKSTRH